MNMFCLLQLTAHSFNNSYSLCRGNFYIFQPAEAIFRVNRDMKNTLLYKMSLLMCVNIINLELQFQAVRTQTNCKR